jgi:hypothetical protein
MKKYMLMTLATATALSSIAAHAASAAPVPADMMVEDFADVSREERRAERQEARANPTPPADVINRAAPQRDNKRAERPRDIARTERTEARQDSRYYDRNRDGDLDRRWDRNRDGSLDRNWDRNRDGRLDQNQIGRWTHNWRKGGGAARMVEISKREEFYAQQYCGCIYSLRDTNKWRLAHGRKKVVIGQDYYGREDPGEGGGASAIATPESEEKK